jgi:DNA polymerase III epsilon subunit-like protein
MIYAPLTISTFQTTLVNDYNTACMPDTSEFFISVDIETAGPYPGDYSLLSIGACTLEEPRQPFYVELKPIHPALTDEAFAIHGLSLAELEQRGASPQEAMQRFAAWIAKVTPAGHRPVMIAFNAPFDWMFVCDYFHRFLGWNPFGHTALDIKAYFMGKWDSTWAETSRRAIAQHIPDIQTLSHNALDDAIVQASLFCTIRDAQKNTARE